MRRSLQDYILLFLKGSAMGASDVIPGVSGGTIAFITGIYQELIHSIRCADRSFFRLLLSFKLQDAFQRINGFFLMVVFSGILISIFSLARAISWLLANHPMMVWSFFFGLIIGSAWFVARSISQWNPLNMLMLGLGSLIAYYITIASPANTPDALWFVFLSGAIAITAMILPGISGSFILLLMGKYGYMMAAVKDLKLVVLGVFALGCAAGLISFSNLIDWLLRKYKGPTMAMLTGFMIGSLNKLWPWKITLSAGANGLGTDYPVAERSVLPLQYTTITGEPNLLLPILLCALGGLMLIILLQWLTKTKSR